MPLQLGTIGLNNGCIDAFSQAASYPEFAHNNTYGVEVISKEIYEIAKHNVTAPGGCLDTISLCRAEAALSDPQGLGNNETVNQICVGATYLCYIQVQGAYTDISEVSYLSPFYYPCSWY